MVALEDESTGRKMTVKAFGKKVPHVFEDGSLENDIEEICQLFGDEASGKGWVLTWKADKDAPSSVLNTSKQIRRLPADQELNLVKSEAMAKSKKKKLEGAMQVSVASVHMELEQLLPGVCGGETVAVDWVLLGGLGTIVAASQKDPKVTEPAMADLCALLRFSEVHQMAHDWFSSNMNVLDIEFFTCLLRSVFDRHVDSSRAGAVILRYFLQEFPELCTRVHAAARGPADPDDIDSGSSFPIYRLMAIALLHDVIDHRLFVLNNLFKAAPPEEPIFPDAGAGVSCTQDSILAALSTELENLGLDADERPQIIEHLMELDERDELRSMMSLYHLFASSGAESLRSENEEMAETIKKLEEDRKKKQLELDRRTEQRLKTLEFVHIPSVPGLARQLRAICKYGYKMLNFNDGYGPLHLACQKSLDPAVVELAALYVTRLDDFEAKDAQGMRPVDYARINPHPGVRAAFDKIRFERFKQAYAAMDASPELKRFMDFVFSKRWSDITWPRGFTAVHQAALEGNDEAVKLLYRLRADVNTFDERRMTPMDYANDQGHFDTVSLLHILNASSYGSGNKGPPMQTMKFGGQKQSYQIPGAIESFQMPSGTQSETLGTQSYGLGTQSYGLGTQSDNISQGGYTMPPGQSGYQLPQAGYQMPPGQSGYQLSPEGNQLPPVQSGYQLSQEGQPPAQEKEMSATLQSYVQMAMQKGYSKIRMPQHWTLLHLAAQEGSLAAVQTLLRNNASVDVEKKNDDGKTPLDYAMEGGHTHLFELLGGEPDPGSPASTDTDFKKSVTLSAMVGAIKATQKLKAQVQARKQAALEEAALAESEPAAQLTEEEKANFKKELQQEMDQKVQQKLEQLAGSLQDDRMKVTDDDQNIDMLGIDALKDMYVEAQARRKLLEQQLETGQQNQEDGVLKGPLDEDGINQFLPKVELGKDACMEALQREKEADGAGLSKEDAALAYSQLEVIKRIADKYKPAPVEAPAPKATKGKGKVGPPPLPGKGGPPAPPKTGKGAPPPPPSAKTGKGSPPPPPKTGKGPPPPKGKGGPPPPKGKGGPPPPKGKGGPPAPKSSKAAAPKQRKPVVKPGARMRMLEWKPRFFGKDLPEDCIWAKAEDRTAFVYEQTIADLFQECLKKPLEERFSVDANKKKVVPKEKEESNKKKVEDLIFPSAFGSGQKRLPFDLYAKDLMSRKLEPDRVAEQIKNMDEMDIEDLRKIRDLFIPDVAAANAAKEPYTGSTDMWEAMKLLNKKREESFEKWALPEEYAWAIMSNVTLAAERLESVIVAKEVPDEVNRLQKMIDVILNMLNSILNSRAVPTYLSILLEVGNFFNGGNSRLGQADGFDFELGSKIEILKDPNGIDVRSLVMEAFMAKLPQEAEEFLNDVNPILSNLKRTIRGEDEFWEDENKQRHPYAKKITSEARLTLEVLEPLAKKLQSQVTKLDKNMPDLLRRLKDPDSPFHRKFEGETGTMRQTKIKADELLDSIAKGKDIFENVKAYYNISPKKDLSTGEFFEEWDELVVPAMVLFRMLPPNREKSQEFIECWMPKFFNYRGLDFQAVQLLYGHTTWAQITYEENKRRHAEKLALKAQEGGGEPSPKTTKTPKAGKPRRKFARKATRKPKLAAKTPKAGPAPAGANPTSGFYSDGSTAYPSGPASGRTAGAAEAPSKPTAAASPVGIPQQQAPPQVGAQKDSVAGYAAHPPGYKLALPGVVGPSRPGSITAGLPTVASPSAASAPDKSPRLMKAARYDTAMPSTAPAPSSSPAPSRYQPAMPSFAPTLSSSPSPTALAFAAPALPSSQAPRYSIPSAASALPGNPAAPRYSTGVSPSPLSGSHALRRHESSGSHVLRRHESSSSQAPPSAASPPSSPTTTPTPQPAAQAVMITFTVPDGATPGTTLALKTRSGRPFHVQVPADKGPGQTMQVEVPP